MLKWLFRVLARRRFNKAYRKTISELQNRGHRVQSSQVTSSLERIFFAPRGGDGGSFTS